MVKIISGTEVSRPTPEALGSSVLDHATVVENGKFGLRNNEGLWPSYNGLDTLNLVSICPDPFTGFKSFGVAEWVPAFEFGLYGGAQCLAVGLDAADQKAEVLRVFEHNEGKGIEEQLRDVRFLATDSDDRVQWDAPVDLTPSAPIPLTVAVGLLEGYAAQVYAGVPTLHLPRAAVAILMGAGVIVEEGGKFFTKTGSKVAAGGGYDEDLLSGEWDLYATGEVYIERTSDIHVQSHVLPGDGSGTGSGENGLSDNSVITLAERLYRVAVDGFVAKVTATVWGI